VGKKARGKEDWVGREAGTQAGDISALTGGEKSKKERRVDGATIKIRTGWEREDA